MVRASRLVVAALLLLTATPAFGEAPKANDVPVTAGRADAATVPLSLAFIEGGGVFKEEEPAAPTPFWACGTSFRRAGMRNSPVATLKTVPPIWRYFESRRTSWSAKIDSITFTKTTCIIRPRRASTI
jgi:hypothetical protein